MKLLLVLAIAVLVVPAAGAEVRKWVDENGVTHYGDHPPADRDSRSVTTYVGPSTGSGRKQLSGEAREMAEGLAEALLKGGPNASTMNCPQAVRNGEGWIDSMLDAGRSNAKHGYLDPSEYERTSRELRKVKGKLSVDECQTAAGQIKLFYLCLSNRNNHIVYCGKKYAYK